MKMSALDQLVEVYSHVSAANQRVFEKAKNLFRTFRDEKIDFLLLRGADLIPYLYGVQGLRTITDIDLLVHEKDLPSVDRMVKALGYRPMRDGNPAYLDSERLVSLDITTEIWYLDSAQEIWERVRVRDWFGIPAKGMGPEDLFVYLLAYETVYRGFFSKFFAGDIERLVEKEALDWPWIAEEIRRRRLDIPIYHALRYLRSNTVLIPESLSKALAPSGPAEIIFYFLFGKWVTERETPGLSHLLLWVTQPPGKKWPWLKKYLSPSFQFLRYRYGSRARNPSETFFLRFYRIANLLLQGILLFFKIVFLTLAPSSYENPDPSRPPSA